MLPSVDPSISTAASQRTAILNLLRTAAEEGVSVAELMDAGGMWWRTRLEEIRRWKLAVIGEQDDRFYLVSEPPMQSFENPSEADHNPAITAHSEPLSLFPSGSSHWREAA